MGKKKKKFQKHLDTKLAELEQELQRKQVPILPIERPKSPAAPSGPQPAPATIQASPDNDYVMGEIKKICLTLVVILVLLALLTILDRKTLILANFGNWLLRILHIYFA